MSPLPFGVEKSVHFSPKRRIGMKNWLIFFCRICYFSPVLEDSNPIWEDNEQGYHHKENLNFLRLKIHFQCDSVFNLAAIFSIQNHLSGVWTQLTHLLKQLIHCYFHLEPSMSLAREGVLCLCLCSHYLPIPVSHTLGKSTSQIGY